MRILIDIGHPAHVHFFKNTIWKLQEDGHEVKITARHKEIAQYLLDVYGFDYVDRGTGSGNIIGKAANMLKTNSLLYKITKSFKPDILMGLHNPYISQVGTLIGKPSLIFTDTEHAKLANKLTFPFASVILTPSCFKLDLGKKQIRYNGYHELAYLHPNYFKPDPSVLDLLGVEKDEKYIIMRFVSWGASHDVGHSGLSPEMKRKAVREFSKHAKVFITSETLLPKDLEKYRIRIPPDRIHDALYYATLLYGESATMASECSILGTPAIFLDNAGRGYTDEQEKIYGSVFNFTESIEDQKKSIQKCIELLQAENLKQEWQKKRKKLLEDKIDVTAFMTRFIENYPESFKIMKANPEYQKRFK